VVKVFEWKGRCGPFELELSDHTFAPSTISRLLADNLSVTPGETVIDVGCGSGVLSIVAAKLGAGRVIGVDTAADTPEVASRNAKRLDVEGVTSFYRGDLFDPLPADLRADLIIGDVSGIPDPVARVSGWFPDGTGGGPRGCELPIRMLEQVPSWLAPNGRLLLPTGSLQDEPAILAAARSVFRRLTRLDERRVPLSSALSSAPELLRLARDRVVDVTRRGARLLLDVGIWECARGPT
jgi:methylase of polypeptide subunit release factors